MNNVPTEEYNIMNIIGSAYRLLLRKVYFDHCKYPIQYGYDGQSWNDLKKFLEICVANHGFNTFSSGGKNMNARNQEQYRVLICKYGVIYKNYVRERKQNKYRLESASNDR